MVILNWVTIDVIFANIAVSNVVRRAKSVEENGWGRRNTQETDSVGEYMHYAVLQRVRIRGSESFCRTQNKVGQAFVVPFPDKDRLGTGTGTLK